MTQPPSDSDPAKQTNGLAIIALSLVVYLLSSGPMIATCFWLREATGWDGFYTGLWLYFPLFYFGQDNPLAWYIEWWVVDVFGTVGPG